MNLLSIKSYRIPVCPDCADGPLVFDPQGLDEAEGMMPRAKCKNGHFVISGRERNLEVVARASLCFCGTPKAARCPVHIL